MVKLCLLILLLSFINNFAYAKIKVDNFRSHIEHLLEQASVKKAQSIELDIENNRVISRKVKLVSGLSRLDLDKIIVFYAKDKEQTNSVANVTALKIIGNLSIRTDLGLFVANNIEVTNKSTNGSRSYDIEMKAINNGSMSLQHSKGRVDFRQLTLKTEDQFNVVKLLGIKRILNTSEDIEVLANTLTIYFHNATDSQLSHIDMADIKQAKILTATDYTKLRAKNARYANANNIITFRKIDALLPNQSNIKSDKMTYDITTKNIKFIGNVTGYTYTYTDGASLNYDNLPRY
jgi:lipopolysaccharide export system protein LptA